MTRIDPARENHVCVVIGADYVKAFVNGSESSNECVPKLPLQKCEDASNWKRPTAGKVFMVLGQRQIFFPAGDFEPTKSFSGKIAGLALWNKALSPKAVGAVYRDDQTQVADFNMESLLTNSTFWSGAIGVDIY